MRRLLSSYSKGPRSLRVWTIDGDGYSEEIRLRLATKVPTSNVNTLLSATSCYFRLRCALMEDEAVLCRSKNDGPNTVHLVQLSLRNSLSPS